MRRPSRWKPVCCVPPSTRCYNVFLDIFSRDRGVHEYSELATMRRMLICLRTESGCWCPCIDVLAAPTGEIHTNLLTGKSDVYQHLLGDSRKVDLDTQVHVHPDTHESSLYFFSFFLLLIRISKNAKCQENV